MPSSRTSRNSRTATFEEVAARAGVVTVMSEMKHQVSPISGTLSRRIGRESAGAPGAGAGDPASRAGGRPAQGLVEPLPERRRVDGRVPVEPWRDRFEQLAEALGIHQAAAQELFDV